MNIEDFTIAELRAEIRRRRNEGSIELVWERLKKMSFKCVCTAAWEDEHTMTYENENGRIGFCVHTPKKENGDFGKPYYHWKIDGKTYKNTKKFLDALERYRENVVPLH